MTTFYTLIIISISGLTTVGPYTTMKACNDTAIHLNEFFTNGDPRAICLEVK